MTDFRAFVFKLAACFGLPWLVLIVYPALSYQSLQPVSYDKDKGDELDSSYGYPLTVVNLNGEKTYAREGCVQCHSQMLRPAHFGLDAWRKGWGQDQAASPAAPARASLIRDYLGENHAFLGITRLGPDLANAGYRFTDRTELHLHLYAPKVLNAWSTMPAYKHLYTVRKSTGVQSKSALPLAGTSSAPQEGYEVVPTPEAEQLVDYLLSLKRDYPTPGSAALAAAAAAPAKK